jgi:transposase
MKRSTTIPSSTVYENKKKQMQKIYEHVIEISENEKLSHNAIAHKLKIAKSTVQRHLARWKRGIPVEDIKPNCRPQKVTPKLRQALGRLVSRNDVPTSKILAKNISAQSRTTIAPRTVRRHLSNYMGYKSSIPRAVPLLTPSQLNIKKESNGASHIVIITGTKSGSRTRPTSR